jgi:hypothetical protein
MIIETVLVCFLLILFLTVGILHSWILSSVIIIILILSAILVFFILSLVDKLKLKLIRRKYAKEKNESGNPKDFRGGRSDGIARDQETDNRGSSRPEPEFAITDNSKESGGSESSVDEDIDRDESSDRENKNSSESDWFTPV